MKKNKLIYVYDPLCTWCYAFSPVLQQFLSRNGEDLEVSIISGGMVRGSRVGTLNTVAPFLRDSLDHIRSKTNIDFGRGFLNNLKEDSMTMDSLPMSCALTIVKKHKPEEQFEFSSRLQRSIYLDGRHPTDVENLIGIAEKIGIKRSLFEAEMQTEEVKYETYIDFQWVDSVNITGFPALIVEKSGEMFLMAKGYTPLEHLEFVYERILADS